MEAQICIKKEIETRRVTPAIEPGYLAELLPASPPHDPEPWEDVMKDVEDKIMVAINDILDIIIMTMITIGGHDPLAAPQVPRLLPRRQLLPQHPRRHALRGHRLRGLLLGRVLL